LSQLPELPRALIFSTRLEIANVPTARASTPKRRPKTMNSTGVAWEPTYTTGAFVELESSLELEREDEELDREDDELDREDEDPDELDRDELEPLERLPEYDWPPPGRATASDGTPSVAAKTARAAITPARVV